MPRLGEAGAVAREPLLELDERRGIDQRLVARQGGGISRDPLLELGHRARQSVAAPGLLSLLGEAGLAEPPQAGAPVARPAASVGGFRDPLESLVERHAALDQRQDLGDVLPVLGGVW